MTLHNRWSKSVTLPVGTEWGVPYTSSVAECMNWSKINKQGSDRYQDSLGKSKATIENSQNNKLSILRNAYQTNQTVTFEPNFDEYDTSRVHGSLRVRPPTPMRTRGDNYADKFSSYYVDNTANGQDFNLDTRNAYGVVSNDYYGRESNRLDTDRGITAHFRAKSVGPYESYRELDHTARHGDDDAELIASYLDARDADTYEQAKRDIYEKTYLQQLDDERKRLQMQRQKEYDDHIRSHSRTFGIDEPALNQAIKKQIRVTSRPPLPKPPSGVRSEHTASFTDPRTRARKVVYEPNGVENLRIVTDNPESMMHRTALSKALIHTMDYPNQSKPIKRVAFRSRPSSASDALNTQRSRKGGHFSGWRNAHDTDPTLKDELWRMPKYQNVKSRIDNKWTSDPYAQRNRGEDGKVGLKLECPPGEEMSVSLRVEATPSNNRTTAYYY